MSTLSEVGKPRVQKLSHDFFNHISTVYHSFYTAALVWLGLSILLAYVRMILVAGGLANSVPEWAHPDQLYHAIGSTLEFGWMIPALTGYLLMLLSRRVRFHPTLVEYLPLGSLYWNCIVLAILVWNLMNGEIPFTLGLWWQVSLAIGFGAISGILFDSMDNWVLNRVFSVHLYRLCFFTAIGWLSMAFLAVVFFLLMSLFGISYNADLRLLPQSLPPLANSILFFGVAIPALLGAGCMACYRTRRMNFSLLNGIIAYFAITNLILLIDVLVQIRSWGDPYAAIGVPWWFSILIAGLALLPGFILNRSRNQ